MTDGERFVGALPKKVDFHDSSKRRSYERTCRFAVRLVDEPGLLAQGLDYLERHVRTDPQQSQYYTLWADLLRRDVRQLVRHLLEDTAEGDLLRDTQPVFVVLPPEEMRTHGRKIREGSQERS
ncbi:MULTISPECIES: hypothetical protein [Methylobacterium]|jgi:hypothetical protein|uniref:hypothetical protein n=1 Tax=Methylobacterium TaxID=407 RepID=UPI0011CB6A44|nr:MULTISPECIES: hypothetical protein [Methylobacterium]TXN67346.1 hypothetical protein FV228_14185 [Methylobacterium sp. WL18]GJE22924.1 hypothetical protein JHFBIEKO_3384 [Methylobacterium mesophilicum]